MEELDLFPATKYSPTMEKKENNDLKDDLNEVSASDSEEYQRLATSVVSAGGNVMDLCLVLFVWKRKGYAPMSKYKRNEVLLQRNLQRE